MWQRFLYLIDTTAKWVTARYDIHSLSGKVFVTVWLELVSTFDRTMQIILSSQGASGAGWGWEWGSSLPLSEIEEISQYFVVKWCFENHLQWSLQLRAHLLQVWNDFNQIPKKLSHFSFSPTYFEVVAASRSAGSITGPCLGTLPSVSMHFCLCCLSYEWKKL